MYVVKSRVPTVNLMIRKAGLDPNNIKDEDRKLFEKEHQRILDWEAGIRKGLVGSWDSAAEEHTDTIKKLEADSKDALVKKVRSAADAWIDDFGLGVPGIWKLDGDARHYKPPGLGDVIKKIKDSISVEIREQK